MTKKTIQIKDLAASENYAVQIRAVGSSEEAQNSDWSLTLQFTTNTDLIAPDKVFGVSVVADGADFVASWSAVVLDANLGTLKDLKNYRVRFFQADDAANFKDFITDNLYQRITFSEIRAELSSVPNISVAVFARDTALNESVTSDVDSVTNVAPSGFPTPVASSESDGQAIKVVFNQPTGVAVNGSDNSDDLSYYEIYKSPSSGTDSLVQTIAFQEGQVSLIDPDPGSDTWTYYVKAYDLYGSFILSPESNAVTPIYPFDDTTSPDPVSALGLAGFAVVNSVSGDEAYINVTFTATVTNDDVTHTDYLDNEGFSVHYRVNGSGDSFEFITIPDLRTGNPLAADTIAVRINGLKTEETYEIGVAAFDTSGNYSSYLSGTELTPVDVTAPGQPSAPVAAADVQSILVTHDLTLQAGGNLPDDTSALIVYASETSGFTSSSANYLGTITVVPNFADAVQKFPLPNSEANVDGADAPAWYVRVRAVDASGNESVESAQNAVTPTLVSGAYIDNATVNDAKINTLSANKLVADSAFVNRLSVESELEVNTDGFIKSSEWDGNDDGSGSTVGWWLGDDGLVVNGGTIEAAALNIIEPNANLARLEFASFANTTQFYSETLHRENMVLVGASAVWSRYGGRSLNLTSTSGGGPGTVYFSGDTTTTDYNVVVEPSTKYVMSCYVYHEFGSPVDIRIKAREDDNSETSPVSGTAASGVATRISYVFTTQATTNAILPGLLVQDAGANVDFHVDGFQIEQVSGGVEEPSFFKSPGYTTIEGNSITTGEIESTNFVSGSAGWQIALDGDSEFNNITARGTVESGNYDAGTTGWRIDNDGTAELNEVTIRGAVYASSGEIGNLDISGLLTATGAGGRVELDQSGIRMYDAITGGNLTVNMDTDTGDATFTGGFATGFIDTERAELSNDGLSFINSSNVEISGIKINTAVSSSMYLEGNLSVHLSSVYVLGGANPGSYVTTAALSGNAGSEKGLEFTSIDYDNVSDSHQGIFYVGIHGGPTLMYGFSSGVYSSSLPIHFENSASFASTVTFESDLFIEEYSDINFEASAVINSGSGHDILLTEGGSLRGQWDDSLGVWRFYDGSTSEIIRFNGTGFYPYTVTGTTDLGTSDRNWDNVYANKYKANGFQSAGDIVLQIDGVVQNYGGTDYTGDYSIYADNTGTGNRGRIWWNAPDAGQMVLGPRSGGAYLNQLTLRGAAVLYGDLSPSSNNTWDLGQSNLRWSEIWQTSGSVTGSDRTIKFDIIDIPVGLDFLNELTPVSYKLRGAKSEQVPNEDEFLYTNGTRNHYGLIAQEVKDIMDAYGIDFGGYVDPAFGGDEGSLALRYDEFLPIAISAIQELSAKVSELEASVSALESQQT